MKLLFSAFFGLMIASTTVHAQTELKQMDATEFKHYITQENHGLVILLPTASWCSICHRVKPDYLRAAKELSSVQIELIEMDYDQNTTYLNSIGVESLPQARVFFNGILRWESRKGLYQLQLSYGAKAALEAALDGSFVIKKNPPIFESVR